MVNLKTWEYFLLITLFTLGGMGIGVSVGKAIFDNNLSIAPTYALDCYYVDTGGNFEMCSRSGIFPLNSLTPFNKFWNEATKNTTFTIDSKPVEITDIQVFYSNKETESKCSDFKSTLELLDIINNHREAKWFDLLVTFAGSESGCLCYQEDNYIQGNITYYPSGVANSQTYVVPTPTPTPCAWPVERTAYSFCGKVIVNSSAEFDLLLKDIERHSYHIQMGWMHLDYEYAHKTYDNTLPAPVNICMGIIPGDNFPIGSEWEGRMAYVIDECASLGSCDFDTLAPIPTPTPNYPCEK